VQPAPLQLEENGESLTAWRNALPSRITASGEDAEGFEVLDLNDRAGWELVKAGELRGVYTFTLALPFPFRRAA